MPKGIQKKIIVIKTHQCSYFESAFFILRNDIPKNTNDDAMLIEAQKIIEESDNYRKKSKHKKSIKGIAIATLALIIGIFCGAAIVGILWFIVG